jgi:hypothetical protein
MSLLCMNMLCLIRPGKARFGGSPPRQLMAAHCFVKCRRDRYSRNAIWIAIAASLLLLVSLQGHFSGSLISGGELVGDCEYFFCWREIVDERFAKRFDANAGTGVIRRCGNDLAQKFFRSSSIDHTVGLRLRC